FIHYEGQYVNVTLSMPAAATVDKKKHLHHYKNTHVSGAHERLISNVLDISILLQIEVMKIKSLNKQEKTSKCDRDLYVRKYIGLPKITIKQEGKNEYNFAIIRYNFLL
ncbi:hypothetical protein ACJX0J_033094, partial [Zea mays]